MGLEPASVHTFKREPFSFLPIHLLFAWERGRFPRVTANVIRLKLATLLENLFEATGKLNKDTDQLLHPRG